MISGTMLDTIVEATRHQLEARKQARPIALVENDALLQSPARDFGRSLRGDQIRIIAEVKRASPSRGVFPVRFDIDELADRYVKGGAAAISVLTESTYFKGCPGDLCLVRSIVPIPVLRKDFIIDRYQVFEARSLGADAVLLIAAILPQEKLAELHAAASALGMAALVEVHDERDLEKALAVPAGIIGINNRDLGDFTVDIGTTFRLRRLVPAGTTVVSESGIHSSADVSRLQQAGIHAVLVGEALVVSPDPGARIRELLSGALAAGARGNAVKAPEHTA